LPESILPYSPAQANRLLPSHVDSFFFSSPPAAPPPARMFGLGRAGWLWAIPQGVGPRFVPGFGLVVTPHPAPSPLRRHGFRPRSGGEGRGLGFRGRDSLAPALDVAGLLEFCSRGFVRRFPGLSGDRSAGFKPRARSPFPLWFFHAPPAYLLRLCLRAVPPLPEGRNSDLMSSLSALASGPWQTSLRRRRHSPKRFWVIGSAFQIVLEIRCTGRHAFP